MSAGVDFTPEQLARLRAQLGLPPGASEQVVEAATVLEFGLAGDLAQAVDEVMNAEAEYLATALEVGWAVWAIEDGPDWDGG